MKQKAKNDIINLFYNNFRPEDVRIFLEELDLWSESGNPELSKLIFRNEKTILDIVNGKNKRYYVVNKLALFFKIPIDLFLVDPSHFLDSLRSYSDALHNRVTNRKRINDAIINAKLRQRIQQERDRQLSFNF